MVILEHTYTSFPAPHPWSEKGISDVIKYIR